jgi:hypothetical protein
MIPLAAGLFPTPDISLNPTTAKIAVSDGVPPTDQEPSTMPTASKTRQVMRSRIWTVALLLAGLTVESSAQTPSEWVGKRVITKFGAVLQVDGRVIDNEKLENSPRGGQRAVCRIYRVEQANGPWL